MADDSRAMFSQSGKSTRILIDFPDCTFFSHSGKSTRPSHRLSCLHLFSALKKVDETFSSTFLTANLFRTQESRRELLIDFPDCKFGFALRKVDETFSSTFLTVFKVQEYSGDRRLCQDAALKRANP